MNSRKRGFRAMALGVLAAASLVLAPSAFAGVSVGINLPGLSIGVGSHHHAYVGIGGGGYYSPGYAPAYYAPAPVVYDDYYYNSPVYVGGYYGPRYYHGGGYYRGYHHGGYYRDGGHYRGGYHHR